jgi:hypothetical protein
MAYKPQRAAFNFPWSVSSINWWLTSVFQSGDIAFGADVPCSKRGYSIYNSQTDEADQRVDMVGLWANSNAFAHG